MQRALDNIIVKYLKDEIIPEDEYGRVSKSEEDFARVLKQCLDEKGVLRELQLFLRQRLIEVLKGSLPKTVASGMGKIYSYSALKLLEDFFCSHKLLFTYSVFGTEVADNFKPKNGFGKLESKEAEELLQEIEIRKDGNLSRAILSHYFKSDRCSLLESIILSIPWDNLNNLDERPNVSSRNRRNPAEKLTNKECFVNRTFPELFFEGQTTFDDKLQEISMALDKNKETVYKLEFERFKEEELDSIRHELESKMKFKLVRKEKELLENYESRMKLMKEQFAAEKSLWGVEKKRDEEELNFQKQQLQQTLRDLRGEKESQVQIFPQKDSNDQERKGELLNFQKNSPRFDAEETRRRIAERRFLIKEAEMKMKIENLMKEKEKIENEVSQVTLPDPHQFNKENSDKLALLQYTIEKQAEEIKDLKTKFGLKKKKDKTLFIKKRSSLNNSQSSECESSSDLSKFLQESKKRCEEIENEARMVERGFKEIKSRHNTECSFYFHPPIPQIPKDDSEQLNQEIHFKENSQNLAPFSLYNFPKSSLIASKPSKIQSSKSPPTLIPKLRENPLVEILKQPLSSKDPFRAMKPNFSKAVEKLEQTIKSTEKTTKSIENGRDDSNEDSIDISRASSLGRNEETNEVERIARRKREAMEFIRNQSSFDEKRRGFESEIKKLISTPSSNQIEINEIEAKESSEERASKSGALIRRKIASPQSPESPVKSDLDSPVIFNREKLKRELFKYSPDKNEELCETPKSNEENLNQVESTEKLRENLNESLENVSKLNYSIDDFFDF